MNSEYSVVYTDRALNHMAKPFVVVMQQLCQSMKTAYNAECCVIVPGSGSFGMEAVARQFVRPGMQERKPLIIRNGMFSYRWTQVSCLKC